MSPDLQDLDALWSNAAGVDGRDLPTGSATALRYTDASALAERDRVDQIAQGLDVYTSSPRRPVNGALIVVPWAAQAQVLRTYAGSVMVLDHGGDVWERQNDWIRQSLGSGAGWMNLAEMPLHARAQQCLETIVRILMGGQMVLFYPDTYLGVMLMLLKHRGISSSALQNQTFLIPSELGFSRPSLEQWFRRRCPVSPLVSRIGDLLEDGQRRWAVTIYEQVFRTLLSARQARDGAHSTVACSRALLQMMVWLREGDETALKVVGNEAASYADIGVARCLNRRGMLLLGVNWKVIEVVEKPCLEDTEWISFLYGRHPDAETALAGAGWSPPLEDEGLCARHEILGRAFHSDMTLLTRGLFSPGSEGRWTLGVDLCNENGSLFRRGKRTTLSELAQSTGAVERALDAVAARLAFRSVNVMRGRHTGTRRQFTLKLQRASGAAEIPPPTVVVSTNPGVDLMDNRWRSTPLSFRWAMPIDRRRRDADRTVAILDNAQLMPEPGAVTAMLGAAALDGLVSIDAQSIFFGSKGDALATYLWANFPHLFQSEYTDWLRQSITMAQGQVVSEALRVAVADLAAVLK